MTTIHDHNGNPITLTAETTVYLVTARGYDEPSEVLGITANTDTAQALAEHHVSDYFGQPVTYTTTARGGLQGTYHDGPHQQGHVYIDPTPVMSLPAPTQ